jgi:hypothetical protein
MTARGAGPPAVIGAAISLSDTLRRELAPRPGRLADTLRLLALILTSVVISETFGIPEVAISAYIIVFISRDEAFSSISLGIARDHHRDVRDRRHHRHPDHRCRRAGLTPRGNGLLLLPCDVVRSRHQWRARHGGVRHRYGGRLCAVAGRRRRFLVARARVAFGYMARLHADRAHHAAGGCARPLPSLALAGLGHAQRSGHCGPSSYRTRSGPASRGRRRLPASSGGALLPGPERRHELAAWRR